MVLVPRESLYSTALIWTSVLSLACGCAGMQDRELAWPKLPSPWSTVKNSTPRSALDSKAFDNKASDSKAFDSKAFDKRHFDQPPEETDAFKTAGRGKSKATRKGKDSPDDQSMALAMLNGLNCERSGDWKQAREVYEEIRKKQPEHVEAAHRLGIVADSQRRHAEAEQLFLFVLERQPRNAAVLGDLGYCYYLQGQLPKAESALRKATMLDPENHRSWNNLGLVVGHQGRYEEALDCFGKSGSEADAHYNLAFIYSAQDRVKEARKCFQFALASDPTHRRAREALVAFDEYEKLPSDLREVDDLAVDGVRYVPYIEGGSSSKDDGGVAATSYSASRATRALQGESRAMLNRNMASQRSEDMSRE